MESHNDDNTHTFECDVCGREITISNNVHYPDGWIKVKTWMAIKYKINNFENAGVVIRDHCSMACISVANSVYHEIMKIVNRSKEAQ